MASVASSPPVHAGTLDDALVASFSWAEERVIEVVNEKPESIVVFQRHLSDLMLRTKTAVEGGLLSSDSLTFIAVASRNIRVVAGFFRDMERNFQRLEGNFTLKSVLSDKQNQLQTQSKVSNKQFGDDFAATDSTKFKPCADYFLAHFASPYPSNDAKKTMALETGSDAKKITMWFTNNRRRSGWNDIMKDHADNNKERMRLLVEDVLNPSESRPVSDTIHEAVHKAKAFISRLAGPEISDVFREALAMKPMSPEEVEEYQKKRHAMQKKISEFVKNAQDERSAHEARKAARAQARAEREKRRAARIAAVAGPSSGKRKRTDENGAVEVDCDGRSIKRANFAVDDAQVASLDSSSSSRT